MRHFREGLDHYGCQVADENYEVLNESYENGELRRKAHRFLFWLFVLIATIVAVSAM